MTHTPGPWRLGPRHADKSFAIHAATASVMRLVHFQSSERQAEANARLIAAAPDLLAALKTAFATLDDLPTTQHGHVRTAWEAARAAIAKAGMTAAEEEM